MDDDRRVALVTGAASPIGLGAGIVRRLARDGWRLVVVDHDERVAATVQGLVAELHIGPDSIVAYVGDVTAEDDVEAAAFLAVSTFGRLDAAIANAGTGGIEIDLVDMAPRDFDSIVAINLRGVYLTARAAGRTMRDARHGSIVLISSIFGQEPVARTAAYSATKAGVIAMTQAMALEMAPFNVRVNSIAPGYMLTEMLLGGYRQRAEHAGITTEQEQERVSKLIPLGRHGSGDDMGSAVAFLVSDEASYITGHTLGVTGGMVRR
jgi:3-oxoacyl-[acyl-carrier protein] reductase